MKIKTLILGSLALLLSFNAEAQVPSEKLNVDLIPTPNSLIQNEGYFTLNKDSKIFVDKQFANSAPYAIEQIDQATDLVLSSSKKEQSSIQILFQSNLNPEEYKLNVDGKNITLYASDQGGVVYGVQTLKQLISLNNVSWGYANIFVPCVSIQDNPQFAWRGFMLDVSRSFYKIEEVYKFVDYMASLKLNRLHLHLSDDQGFRVEMKKYPKLNSVGSWRVSHVVYDENDNSVWGRPVQKDGELANHGGYYTAQELKDLVEYAKMRNIEILPEIDVPGHSQAIIASYPELSCEPHVDFKVATGGVRTGNTLCPSTEASYEFMDAVIGEICEIFPFEYIHIGGDECNKAQWSRHDQCQHFKKEHGLKDENELQSHFIHRVEKLVNAHGRKMIGWDEILDGGLAPNATVMSWRGESGGIAAAKMGHNVIMSPNHSNYLDLKQGQSDFEPNLGYSQALIKNSYTFEIIPKDIPQELRHHIIGNQANLWTETFAMPTSLWYMTLPRLHAVAENAWSLPQNKDWDGFVGRLKTHMRLMDFEGVRHAKSIFNPWLHHKGDGRSVKVWFTSQVNNPEIRYTLNGSDPVASSPLYVDTLTIDESATLRAAIFEDGERLGDVVARYFPIHKARGAKVKVYTAKTPNGEFEGGEKFTDLSFGQYLEGGDTAWVEFWEDPKIEVIFDTPTDVNSVSVSTQRHTLTSLYAAKQIIVYGKTAGGEYREIGNSGELSENIKSGRNLFTDVVDAKAAGLSSIMVEIKRQATVPQGYVPDMVGGNTKLCVDEIVVN